MNEQQELKLSMTIDEIKDILGEPDEIKTDSWGAVIFYYYTQEENIKIRFVDDFVVHIRECSQELND